MAFPGCSHNTKYVLIWLEFLRSLYDLWFSQWCLHWYFLLGCDSVYLVRLNQCGTSSLTLEERKFFILNSDRWFQWDFSINLLNYQHPIICKMTFQNTQILCIFLVNIPVPLTIYTGLHNWSISMECISLPAAYGKKQNTLPFNARPVHYCTDL